MRSATPDSGLQRQSSPLKSDAIVFQHNSIDMSTSFGGPSSLEHVRCCDAYPLPTPVRVCNGDANGDVNNVVRDSKLVKKQKRSSEKLFLR